MISKCFINHRLMLTLTVMLTGIKQCRKSWCTHPCHCSGEYNLEYIIIKISCYENCNLAPFGPSIVAQ